MRAGGARSFRRLALGRRCAPAFPRGLPGPRIVRKSTKSDPHWRALTLTLRAACDDDASGEALRGNAGADQGHMGGPVSTSTHAGVRHARRELPNSK